jgi:hypothetical protein
MQSVRLSCDHEISMLFPADWRRKRRPKKTCYETVVEGTSQPEISKLIIGKLLLALSFRLTTQDPYLVTNWS